MESNMHVGKNALLLFLSVLCATPSCLASQQKTNEQESKEAIIDLLKQSELAGKCEIYRQMRELTLKTDSAEIKGFHKQFWLDIAKQEGDETYDFFSIKCAMALQNNKKIKAAIGY